MTKLFSVAEMYRISVVEGERQPLECGGGSAAATTPTASVYGQIK